MNGIRVIAPNTAMTHEKREMDTCRTHVSSKLLCLAMGLTLLAGCNTNNLKADKPDAIAQSVESSATEVAGETLYEGPTLSYSGDHDGDTESMDVTLRAVTQKKGPRYFLEVVARYEGHWRNYIRAVDAQARSFQGHAIMNHPRCELFCSFEDKVEIEIDAAYITSHKSSGMAFWLTGPAAKSPVALNIPTGYLQGFLERVPLPKTAPTH
jgi:hypothetical protein